MKTGGKSSAKADKRKPRGASQSPSPRAGSVADSTSSRGSTKSHSPPVDLTCSLCHSRMTFIPMGTAGSDPICPLCQSNKNIRKIRREISKRQSEARNNIHPTPYGRRGSSKSKSPSPESNLGRGTQSSASLLIDVLNREQRRVDMENANKPNGNVESDGSDSSDSIYNPPPASTRENQPTDPDHFPYMNPGSSVDFNQYNVPYRESSLRSQSHPAVFRGPFGPQRVSQQERYPALPRHPGPQAVTESASKYGTHTSSQVVPPEPVGMLPMDSADIQGAATLMSLGHDANLEYSASATRPVVTQTPQRNYSPHMFHDNTQVTWTPSPANPGLPNLNPVSYPNPDWIALPPTRTQSQHYHLQEGSVHSPAHQPVGYPQSAHQSVGYPQFAQNFNYSTRPPQPEALMYVPYRDPHPPASWPILPPLQFRTTSYDRHQSSIGLVRAPIGSSSRIGNSPWKLAACNEVPDFRMTGTAADRQLDIFYVPNADGEFPSHNQPRSSLAQTDPVTMAPYQNPPLPEDEISGIRMGSEDEERAVHVNEQKPVVINDNPPIDRNQPRTTIVIDDDMPRTDRPVVPRPSKIKWPEDEFTHGLRHC